MSNNTIVIGNLGSDPELRYTPNRKAVVTLRVADTPRNFDRASGQWVNGETDWITVQAWEELAQNVAASLKKGDKVVVIGSYRAEKYTDNNNQERTTRKLVATEIAPSLTGARASIEKQARAAGDNAGAGSSAPAPSSNSNAGFGDDTPF